MLINDLVSSTGSKQSSGLSRIDGSIDACSDDNNFLILPSDTEYLTDYLMLLFGQVKRGSMTCTDQSKANRSCKYNLGFLGMRCRNCGGHEKVSRTTTARASISLVELIPTVLLLISGKLLSIIEQKSASGLSYASYTLGQV